MLFLKHLYNVFKNFSQEKDVKSVVLHILVSCFQSECIFCGCV